MSRYTHPLTKQEALQVIRKNENVLAYYPECSDTNDIVVNIVAIKDWDLQFIYNQRNDCLYITREDYAMYVNMLPEGYDYPNKPIRSGIYDNLYGICRNKELQWDLSPKSFSYFHPDIKWHEVLFKTEDLARVEAETGIVEPKYITQPITDKIFGGYFYNSTMQKITEEKTDSTIQFIEGLQFEKAMLEKEVEELKDTLILQRSRARVLINYYKERNTLNQNITKLEEELNG